MQMILALNAPTAQHVTDRKKMLKARRGWTVHSAHDRQANCFRVPVLSRETPGEYRDLWAVRYRTGGNLCKKRHSMQICKYGDSEAIRDANFPRVELCAGRTCYTQNYKLPWFVCIFNWFKTEFQTAYNN